MVLWSDLAGLLNSSADVEFSCRILVEHEGRGVCCYLERPQQLPLAGEEGNGGRLSFRDAVSALISVPHLNYQGTPGFPRTGAPKLLEEEGREGER